MFPTVKPPASRAPAGIATWRAEPEVAAVELVDVTFGYDVRPVLKGITMTIPRGKIVAIMGGSGCGKTTILRLIGGQLRPQSGQIRVGGLSVPDLDPEALYDLRRKYGMLFQFGALFTDMSVFENIAFPMREHTELPEELIRDLVLMKLHAVGLRGFCRHDAAVRLHNVEARGHPERGETGFQAAHVLSHLGPHIRVDHGGIHPFELFELRENLA